MTKKFSVLVLCMILAVGFSIPALAQDDPWADVDPTGQTVTFWWQHSGAREEALLEIVEEFNATNEYGITVEGVNQGGYDDIFRQMLLVVGTDDAPDLVVAYQNQAATYQISEGLVDMRTLVESPTYGLAEDEIADFFAGFYAQDLFPNFDDARLGFPPNRSLEVMYYNIEWLAELSESGAISFDGPPTTPEQFREAACAATENPFSAAAGDDSIGYILSLDASRFAAWTFAFGGDVFDYEANEYSYDSEAAVEAMTFLQGLFDDGCALTPAEPRDDQTRFGLGTNLFAIGSSSGLPFYQAAVDSGAEFEWTVGAIPHTTDEPVMNVYGASVSIASTSPERALASWIFLKYYTSPEVQAEWAIASNYFPVRASVAEGLDEYFADNATYEAAFNLLQYSRAEPPTPGYDFVRDLIQQQMAAIMDGADVVETLTAANAAANDILAEQFEQMEDM